MPRHSLRELPAIVAAATVVALYSEDQPRDDDGRFAAGAAFVQRVHARTGKALAEANQKIDAIRKTAWGKYKQLGKSDPAGSDESHAAVASDHAVDLHMGHLDPAARQTMKAEFRLRGSMRYGPLSRDEVQTAGMRHGGPYQNPSGLDPGVPTKEGEESEFEKIRREELEKVPREHRRWVDRKAEPSDGARFPNTGRLRTQPFNV